MPIEVIDTKAFGHKEKKRTVVLDTDRFHAWVHYYKPDQKDEMHCHNQDQTFQVIEGVLTMNFPDGGSVILTPGMMATITGGSFYQLHNKENDPLIMIGTRSGAVKNTVKVEHGTGRIINERINYSK
ncbi:MAG: cupin domain-containing protein [SAR202 cluster bacterium]|mgnify:CR=1 FL=1|nr:cupin domain-containing protein [SAR202 cluster bacterium]|tara:strand:+ start:6543 stop:6923 length:381 start_codon:yes stop_codon:yes gene_type:complete